MKQTEMKKCENRAHVCDINWVDSLMYLGAPENDDVGGYSAGIRCGTYRLSHGHGVDKGSTKHAGGIAADM